MSTIQRISRAEAEKRIAILRGAKYSIRHADMCAWLSFEPEADNFSPFVPHGYKALLPAASENPFWNATASKALRDDLAAKGWLWKMSRDPRSGLCDSEAINREGQRHYCFHEDEFTVVALVYLEALTGERFELEADEST